MRRATHPESASATTLTTPPAPTSTWFHKGAGCALLFSLLSIAWLLLVVSHGASSSREASASLLPLVGETQTFEQEILLARISFVYYVTIDKPGALDAAWPHFGAAHASMDRMDAELAAANHGELIRGRYDALRAAWDVYEQRLAAMLATVGHGERTGPVYEAEVSDWAAAGERLVATGRDVQSGSQAMLASTVNSTSFLLRLALLLLCANGAVWLGLGVLACADRFPQAWQAGDTPEDMPGSTPGSTPESTSKARPGVMPNAASPAVRNGLAGLVRAGAALVRHRALRLRTLGGWLVMSLAVAALLVTGLFALHSMDLLTDEQEWVMHSEQVLADVQALRVAVYKAESATRAYSVTGSPDQLTAQQAAMHEARQLWQKLRGETAGDPREQTRLLAVYNALDLRFGSMLRIADARRTGGVPAVTLLIKSGSTRLFKQQLDARIAELDSAEHQLLMERSLDTQRQATVSKALIGFVALPAALGLGILGLLTTISLRRNTELQEKMAHLAHHDPLTGLPNRLALRPRLAGMLERAGRAQSHLAVLALDLDHFKEVNDRYGHETGDLFLRGVVARLGAALRSSDTLVRIGGDEFLCLLDTLRSAGDAELVAEKLLRTLREPLPINGVALQASASVGIALYPADGSSAEELQRQADAALYAAKSAGRGCARTTAALAAQPTPAPPTAMSPALPSTILPRLQPS